MGNCSTCSSKDTCGAKSGISIGCGKLSVKYGNIKNVIGVISGKGGVGKSTVTGILATTLANIMLNGSTSTPNSTSIGDLNQTIELSNGKASG